MTLEFKGIDDEDDLKRIDHLWVWLQSLPFSDLVSSWTGNKLCLHKNTNDYVQYVMCTCDNISVFILAFIRSNDKRISPKYAELIWLGVKDKNEGDASYAIYFSQVTLFCHIFQIADAAKNYKAYRRVQGILIPGAESVAAREQWRHMSSWWRRSSHSGCSESG